MVHVEYTKQPDKFRLLPLPDGKVKIELRENIASERRETDGETYTVWTADQYELVKSPRIKLADHVASNFDAYIAEAKSK